MFLFDLKFRNGSGTLSPVRSAFLETMVKQLGTLRDIVLKEVAAGTNGTKIALPIPPVAIVPFDVSADVVAMDTEEVQCNSNANDVVNGNGCGGENGQSDEDKEKKDLVNLCKTCEYCW